MLKMSSSDAHCRAWPVPLVMQDFFSGDCWHSRRRQGTRSCKSRVRGFLGDHRQAGLAPHLAGAPRYIATGFQGDYCCNIAGFIAVLPGTALRMSWCLCLPQLARFMSWGWWSSSAAPTGHTVMSGIGLQDHIIFWVWKLFWLFQAFKSWRKPSCIKMSVCFGGPLATRLGVKLSKCVEYF